VADPVPPPAGSALADVGPRPLAGVRILDLTRVLAGPVGTMTLGDLGADVVKVERPGTGDDLRAWGPPFTADGESAYFLAVNRNKRSIVVDLKSDAGRDVLRRLVRDADVVVENFRAGTLEQLGLGWDDLRAANERLVLVSLTAYGSEGPYRDLPGYDIVVQAMGGLMSVTGEPDGRPMRVGVAIVDVLSGLYIAIAILAALRERDRTGDGQRVELSLLGVELASLVNVVHNQLIAGEAPRRLGNAHPSIVPYEVFASLDGHLAIAVATEAQWQRFCQVLGEPALAADDRFARNPARVANRGELMAILEARLAARSTASWVDALRAADVPCGPVNSIAAILADPQVAASGLIRTIDRPEGPIDVIGSPLRFASGPLPATSPPRLGEHTDAVLAAAGFEPAEIDRLRRDGAVA
jgi:crotonobetainyl-CoA:carnitine CoA-transferase CaiB-like acyl-CoA transferase